MTRTADGIDHGSYIVRVCIWALIEQYEDGYILCPIEATGGSCEECYQYLEEHPERWEEK